MGRTPPRLLHMGNDFGRLFSCVSERRQKERSRQIDRDLHAERRENRRVINFVSRNCIYMKTQTESALGFLEKCDVNKLFYTSDMILWSLLHEACCVRPDPYICTMSNHADICRMLIKLGAHVNIQAHAGLAPLHIAVWHGRKDLVDVLLENGCDVNAEDGYHETALSLAVCHGQMELVGRLLEAGSRMDIRSWGACQRGASWFTVTRSNTYHEAYAPTSPPWKTFENFINRRTKGYHGRRGNFDLLSLALDNSWANIAQILLIHGILCNQVTSM